MRGLSKAATILAVLRNIMGFGASESSKHPCTAGAYLEIDVSYLLIKGFTIYKSLSHFQTLYNVLLVNAMPTNYNTLAKAKFANRDNQKLDEKDIL